MIIIPTVFGPIADISEIAAREFMLYTHEPVGRVLIYYQTKRFIRYAI